VKLNKLKISWRIILLSVVALPWLLAIIPIKFSKRSFDSINEKEYFVISYVPNGSTESGWHAVWHHDGVEEYIGLVNIKGKSPRNTLSSDTYTTITEFVIYGSLKNEYCESSDYRSNTIYSKKWDIIGKVDRRKGSGKINFKHFITIYDLKWWDNFFSD